MFKSAALSLSALLFVAAPAGAPHLDVAGMSRTAAAPGAHTVAISGAGGGKLALTGFEGDRVRFRMVASVPANRPLDVEGRFRVVHVSAEGSVLAAFRGDIDCLMAGGGVAVMTGTITSGSAPGLPDDPELVGRRVGLTVADQGGADRLGWSWLVHGFTDVSRCTSIAPFFPGHPGGVRRAGRHRVRRRRLMRSGRRGTGRDLGCGRDPGNSPAMLS